MVSEELMKMIMEDQRRDSKECHRDQMKDREREIAVMKVQLEVLKEWLQEEENQRGGWIFPLKGKRVIWQPLKMKWRQKEIDLWKEELRFFESKIEFEDSTCKSVQGEMLEEAKETERSFVF